MVFHGFWLVSMVFQGNFMIFHGFWLVSMVFQGGHFKCFSPHFCGKFELKQWSRIFCTDTGSATFWPLNMATFIEIAFVGISKKALLVQIWKIQDRLKFKLSYKKEVCDFMRYQRPKLKWQKRTVSNKKSKKENPFWN